MNKSDIRSRQSAIKKEMAELASEDEFTVEQAERFTELEGEFSGLQEKMDVIERASVKRSSVDLSDLADVAPRESTSSFDRDPLGDERDVERVSPLDNPWDIEEVRRAKSPEDIYSRAMSAVEKTPGSTDARREALSGMLKRGDTRMAKIVLATTSPAYKTAYGKLVRSGGREDRAKLTSDERDALDFASEIGRAVSAGTDGEGGYFIPTDIEPEVTLTADGTNNPLWELSRRVQTTSDTYRVVGSPNAAWSWDGENTEVSDDQPTFTNTDIPLYVAQGFVPVSIAANQSIANITETVSQVLMGGWNDLVGAALTTGSGSSQPTGIVTALTGSAQASASTDTFAVADVYQLYENLAARYRRNATWMANIAAISDMRQFATDDGNALLARLGDGPVERLLGRPLVENEDMDGTIGTGDDYYLLFGDFSHFVIASGIGMMTEIIPHVFGSNGRPIGARGFYATSRFGSDSVNDGAFELLNVT